MFLSCSSLSWSNLRVNHSWSIRLISWLVVRPCSKWAPSPSTNVGPHLGTGQRPVPPPPKKLTKRRGNQEEWSLLPSNTPRTPALIFSQSEKPRAIFIWGQTPSAAGKKFLKLPAKSQQCDSNFNPDSCRLTEKVTRNKGLKLDYKCTRRRKRTPV